MNIDLAALQSAAEALEEYLHKVELVEKVDRDRVRKLVHRVNEAYLNWAFDVDNAKLQVVK